MTAKKWKTWAELTEEEVDIIYKCDFFSSMPDEAHQAGQYAFELEGGTMFLSARWERVKT